MAVTAPWRALAVSLLLFQSCCVKKAEGSCGNSILKQDFNSYPGAFTFCTSRWADELFPLGPERRSGDGAMRISGMLKGGAVGLERLMIGHKMAKINLREGCVGAKTTATDGRPCGVLLQVRLAKALESATFTYKVKFSRDFDWTLGGKLPGLCSENCPVGCRAVTHNAGWSNRIMWRREGHLVSYAYYPDKQRRCGVDMRWQRKVTAGSWHEIKTYLKMNIPGISNGVQKVWLDGELIWEAYNLLYRNRPGHKIEKLLFNNFHGGNANGPNAKYFAPHQDQAVWIDDIHIQEGECPGMLHSPLQQAMMAEAGLPVLGNTLMQERVSALSGISVVTGVGNEIRRLRGSL